MEVLALIPAYNEEKTIGNVLKALKQVPEITKIIVVSDGSTDNTVGVAKSCDVEVVELRENLGKGGAMQAGLNSFKADVVLFLDADLLGLTPQHVHNLLEPVIENKVDMTIGIFDRGRIATDLAQKMAPYLSGQRALKFSLLEEISDLNVARFGVELALNRYIENSGVKVKEVTLLDMSHVMKEEKMGVWKGMAARMKMYWEILKYLTLVDSKIKIK
jgi:glycosyltransferase involved in cell wall biosynthesis